MQWTHIHLIFNSNIVLNFWIDYHVPLVVMWFSAELYFYLAGLATFMNSISNQTHNYHSAYIRPLLNVGLPKFIPQIHVPVPQFLLDIINLKFLPILNFKYFHFWNMLPRFPEYLCWTAPFCQHKDIVSLAIHLTRDRIDSPFSCNNG